MARPFGSGIFDLRGKRFGRLTAIEPTDKRPGFELALLSYRVYRRGMSFADALRAAVISRRITA